MTFTQTDLKWTKNVKRAGGNEWAYMEFNVGDIFFLNWPRGRAEMGKTNALSVRVNELMLIFQTVNKNSGSLPGTYISHVVTPIHENLHTDYVSSHPYMRQVTVVAKANPPILKPTFLDFRQPNRGWLCNLDLIKSMPNSGLQLSLSRKQEILWDLFNDIDSKIKDFNSISDELAVTEQIDGALEGEEKYLIARHKYYERDPNIISRKKRIASEQNCLICEICNFDFSRKYGNHGIGFIECHHLIPIAKNGQRHTTIDDLALVCSNCHRMLHRKNHLGEYFSICELKSLLGGSNI